MTELERLDRLIEEARARRDEARKLEADLDRAADTLWRERRREADARRGRLGRFLDSLLGRRREAAPVPGATDALEAEVSELRSRIAALGDAEREYERLLGEKESALKVDGGEAGRLLIDLARETARNRELAGELEDAREAGVEAESVLTAALEELGGAGRWGVFDILGGGVIATAVKHGRINEANRLAGDAARSLDRFRRELADVEEELDASLETELGRLLTVGDFLLDGLFVDLMVQSRIRDAERRVRSTHDRVCRLLSGVERRLAAVHEDLREAEAARLNLLETPRPPSSG